MMEIICFVLFFLIWSPFTHSDLVFRLMLGIILWGTIRSISRSDPHYNILFEDCNDSCEPTYYIKENLKKKVIYLLLFL
jgi:hypothetical protein